MSTLVSTWLLGAWCVFPPKTFSVAFAVALWILDVVDFAFTLWIFALAL